MSMNFGGNNEGYYTATDVFPVTALPVTIAARFNPDAPAMVNNLFMVCLNASGVGTGGDRFCLNADGGQAGDPVGVSWRDAGSTAVLRTSTGFTQNTWHHACGVWATTTETRVYIDGGSKGTDLVTNKNPTVNRISIGFLQGSGSAEFDGKLAEVAVWNVALTDAEVAILGNSYSPLLVRPASLAYYNHLINEGNRDLIGGLTLTTFGTPDIFTHPRVLYPRK